MKRKLEVPLCAHLKTNGTQCQSPAMGDSYYCYFHERLHQRHKRYRNTEAKKLYLDHTRHIQLHALEDAESVQLAISLVVNAIATGELNPKCAPALLTGLRLASQNLRRLSPSPAPREVIRHVATEADGIDRSCSYQSISLDPLPESPSEPAVPSQPFANPHPHAHNLPIKALPPVRNHESSITVIANSHKATLP